MGKLRKSTGVCPSALGEKETQVSTCCTTPEVTTSRPQFQPGLKLRAISTPASWRRLSRPHATASAPTSPGPRTSCEHHTLSTTARLTMSPGYCYTGSSLPWGLLVCMRHSHQTCLTELVIRKQQHPKCGTYYEIIGQNPLINSMLYLYKRWESVADKGDRRDNIKYGEWNLIRSWIQKNL